MKVKRFLIAVLLSSSILTGCGSLTGLQDAESNFACSVDMTPRCASLSSVHESLDREETQKNIAFDSSSANTVQIHPVTTDAQTIDRLAYETPLMTPKRAPEEILRVWVAPYIDTDGDLHAEHVILSLIHI